MGAATTPQVFSIRQNPVMRLRDSVLPLLDGPTIFNLPPDRRRAAPFAVVVEQNQQRVGLMVSRLIGQQEVVIKPLNGLVEQAGPVSGATVRDDGGVSLIVDVGAMLRLAEQSRGHHRAPNSAALAPDQSGEEARSVARA